MDITTPMRLIHLQLQYLDSTSTPSNRFFTNYYFPHISTKKFYRHISGGIGIDPLRYPYNIAYSIHHIEYVSELAYRTIGAMLERLNAEDGLLGFHGGSKWKIKQIELKESEQGCWSLESIDVIVAMMK